MAKTGKLELTWVGKDQRQRLEPRLLLEDPAKSYGDPASPNMLIRGDNLLALKALEQDFTNRIKCVYIDPPFNTGQAFEHYDDSVEHSLWLTMMRDRIEILHRLMAKDGLFWIHLDDSEIHYCKVFLDELFGRNNFVANITYERSGAAGLGLGGFIVNTAESILLYKKSELPEKRIVSSQLLDAKTMKRYNKALVEKGERELVFEFNAKSNRLPVSVYKHRGFKIETISLKKFEEREDEIRTEFATQFKHLFRTNQIQKENEFQRDLVSRMDKAYLYTVDYTPSRGKHEGKTTTLFYHNAELFAWLCDTAIIEDGQIMKASPITNVWAHAEIPKADIANEGGVDFPRGKKPEHLLKRIIEMSTDPGDWVIDSFAGSGTTAATSHKMGRKWITVEMGEHCATHVLPRLKAVVDGTDSLGISKHVGWTGGGGFKYFQLAESLLVADELLDHYLLNPKYDAGMLIRAICKIENFRYRPRGRWHGYSSETHFIHVVTQMLNQPYLDMLCADLDEQDALLIYCTKRDAGLKLPSNVRIKRIPKDLLARCEFRADLK